MTVKIDQQELDDLSAKMKNQLNSIFNPLLQPDNSLLRGIDVAEIDTWYEESKENRDDILSKIANSLVTNLMTTLPTKYVQISVEEIKIDTLSAKPGIKFSPKFELKTIKPFVEIQLLVNGIPTKKARFTFEIQFDGIFNNIEIIKTDGKTEACLGTFVSNVTASLIKIPFINLKEPRVIAERTITVDLSPHKISL